MNQEALNSNQTQQISPKLRNPKPLNPKPLNPPKKILNPKEEQLAAVALSGRGPESAGPSGLQTPRDDG